MKKTKTIESQKRKTALFHPHPHPHHTRNSLE